MIIQSLVQRVTSSKDSAENEAVVNPGDIAVSINDQSRVPVGGHFLDGAEGM